MNRPRFLDFRNQVAAYAQSVGSPLGVCVGNIPALTGLVNIATERLISDPLAPDEGFWGSWGKFVFNVSQSNPYFVAPREVARAIVTDVNSCPVKIQNEFYEFLDFGRGLQPKPCQSSSCDGFVQAYDRNTVATLGTLNSGPQTIRIFPTDARDVGKTVIVQGPDQNGNTVTSTDPITNATITGEVVPLQFPFSNTVNQFTGALTGLQKDFTFGSVTIQQVNPTTGASSSLSSMEPTETTASYRRYLVNNLPCQGPITGTPIQVTAMCKLEYVPIASDSDYLGIPCVPALLAETECLRYENMDTLKAQQLAIAKHNKALSLLFGQLDHYLGKERPAVEVNLFSPRKMMRCQPI